MLRLGSDLDTVTLLHYAEYLVDLPAKRHPALVRQRELLEDAVERSFPAEQRPDALASDRQGLGMTIHSAEGSQAPGSTSITSSA